MTSSLSAREARDVLYLEYMSAYEEYVRLELEMGAQLRAGHIALSKARRDLSAKHISLGKTLYPCEFSALLKVVETDEADDGEADDGGSRGPTLRVHTVTDAEAEAAYAKAAAEAAARASATPGPGEEGHVSPRNRRAHGVKGSKPFFFAR